MQESTQDKLSSFGIGAGMLLMIVVGLIQVISAWFGWADLIGWGWTIPLLFVAMMGLPCLARIFARSTSSSLVHSLPPARARKIRPNNTPDASR